MSETLTSMYIPNVRNCISKEKVSNPPQYHLKSLILGNLQKSFQKSDKLIFFFCKNLKRNLNSEQMALKLFQVPKTVAPLIVPWVKLKYVIKSIRTIVLFSIFPFKVKMFTKFKSKFIRICVDINEEKARIWAEKTCWVIQSHEIVVVLLLTDLLLLKLQVFDGTNVQRSFRRWKL
jgi:hypothetical protein